VVFRWGRAVRGGNIIWAGRRGYVRRVSYEFVALLSLLGGWMSTVTEAVREVVFEYDRGG